MLKQYVPLSLTKEIKFSKLKIIENRFRNLWLANLEKKKRKAFLLIFFIFIVVDLASIST